MNPSENKKKLDELLTGALQQKPLKFDLDTWKQQHAQEIAEFQAACKSGASLTDKRTAKMKSLILKFAVAAGIIIAALVGIGLFDNWFGGNNVAFAQVLKNIQNRNYAFELILTALEGDKQQVESTNRVLIKEPGKMRFDTDILSSVTDFNSGKTLILFHRYKSAAIMENSAIHMKSGDEGIVGLWTKPVSALWNLKDGTEKSLGTKEINGQKVAGFAISQEDPYLQYEMSIWARVDDSTPCLVEVMATPKDKKEAPFQWTMRKFEMDVQCDESQFSFETPAGYTLAYQKKLEETPAKGVPSSSAKKIEESLILWTDGKKEQAVELLLNINWTLPVEFDRQPYIFSMTEKEYITLKAEDQKKVMEESLASAAVIKQITRHFLDLGQQVMANKEYEKAEKIFLTNNHLGELLCKDPDRMILARMVGVAVEKKTLNECIQLYTQTNNSEKLQAAQKQLELVTAWGDEIKRKVSGK